MNECVNGWNRLWRDGAVSVEGNEGNEVGRQLLKETETE
jgi:hypothetical protein